MHKALGIVLVAAIAVSACTSGGTSGAGGGGGSDPNCPAYTVPAGTVLMSPIISFKTEVMPIFNANCGASNCHGDGTSSQGNLFLGSETAKGSDASMVRSGLVAKDGIEMTMMPLVTAGDPAKSYLMHKLDGDQCLYNEHCANKTCLAEMPSGLGHALPVANRDTIRRWIAQGAHDN
jgi:hypothetical protein